MALWIFVLFNSFLKCPKLEMFSFQPLKILKVNYERNQISFVDNLVSWKCKTALGVCFVLNLVLIADASECERVKKKPDFDRHNKLICNTHTYTRFGRIKAKHIFNNFINCDLFACLRLGLVKNNEMSNYIRLFNRIGWYCQGKSI